MEATTLRALTAHIVSGYVSKNPVQQADLPATLRTIADALVGLLPPSEPARPALAPPVPVNSSVTPDFLISLEDGKPYKSLKRHLGIRGLTPDQYREKWGLPKDYPMVAPNYGKVRSQLAKAMGLGRKQTPARAKGARKAR